jgi:glycopeptide antibiotics resistance protein
LAGAIAGGIVFALFVGLGLTLLNRVANDLPVIILGVAGAYAGWLVGVIVFGSVRGANIQTDEVDRSDKEERS